MESTIDLFRTWILAIAHAPADSLSRTNHAGATYRGFRVIEVSGTREGQSFASPVSQSEKEKRKKEESICLYYFVCYTLVIQNREQGVGCSPGKFAQDRTHVRRFA
jgi:hypothetical protein